MTIGPRTHVQSSIEGPRTAAPAGRPSVFVALAVSVDGYITGPDPSPAQALGRDGGQLFDWYTDGDVPSREFGGFRLSAASAQVFDSLAARVGAVIAGRRTYDHSDGCNGGPPTPARSCSCSPTDLRTQTTRVAQRLRPSSPPEFRMPSPRTSRSPARPARTSR